MDHLSFLVLLTLPLMALQYLLSARKKLVGLPPGPLPLPIIGNLFELRGKPLKCLLKLSETYGPLMSLRIGHQTIVVASSTSIAKELLRKNDMFVSNRSVGDALRAHRHDEFSLIYLTVGTRWRSLRKICNAQIFSSIRLEASQGLRQMKVDELLSYVHTCSKDRVVVDIGQAAFTTALNFLSNALFSVDLADYTSDTCRDLKRLIWAICVETSNPNLLVDFFHIPFLSEMDPHANRRHMETLFSQLMDIISNVVEQWLDESREKNTSGSHRDLLGALLQEDIGDVKHSQVLHLFMDLFVAGTESTSGMVEWTLAELLRNPDKMRMAKLELQQVIGKGRRFQENDISKLPYLEAIIKEVFRLHPVVPLLPRRVDTDIEIRGFRVPKNSRVWISMYAMGRDHKVWEKPDSFEPERFLGKDNEAKTRYFDQLMPFGGGRRICPALPLAMKMVPLILGSLLHFFDWKLEDGADPLCLDMDYKLGVSMLKAQPLCVIPNNSV